MEEVILAGPTCDSMDILYERTPYFMPSSAKIGDKVYILTAGIHPELFVGVLQRFPPLQSYILPSE